MSELRLRVRLLVSAVALVGVAVVAREAPEVLEWAWRDWAACAGLVAAAIAAQQFLIPLPHRTETQSFSMIDALWAGGLLLVEPSVLVVAVAFGVLSGQLIGGVRAYKVVFNVGAELIAIALALALFGALAGPAAEPRAWLMAAAAMLIYFLVNAGLVSLAIAYAVGERFLPVLLPPLRLDLLQWAAKVSLGLLVAVVWLADPAVVPLLGAPLVLAHFSYRGWVRSIRERDRMEAMAHAADDISEQGDLEKRIEGGDGDDEVGSLAGTLNRMLDRLENSFRRERRFISKASHELRTPLTICFGHLDLLGPNPDPEDVREAIDIVFGELERMGRLIEDLATLALADERQFVLPEPVSIERFREDVVQRATPLLNGRLRSAPVVSSAVVRADAQRLTQALINLLHNAAVHTPPGTPVELRILEREGCWRFEVSDDGDGLSVGREETLFEPFSRGSTTAPGSGLGLSIVREIAEAHGGCAGVLNRPGEGATFWLEVPR